MNITFSVKRKVLMQSNRIKWNEMGFYSNSGKNEIEIFSFFVT